MNQTGSDLENMIWRPIARFAHLGDSVPILMPKALYVAVDGLFQAALARVVSGEDDADAEMEEELPKLMRVAV